MTNHALDRITERLGVPPERAEATFKQLWRSSREARNSDFIVFGAAQLPNKIYRISGDGQWMLVRSKTTGRWITLISRRGDR